MAIKDVEIPLYRLSVGAVPLYTFNFQDVLPTGHTLADYEVVLEDCAVARHEPSVSILSDGVILVGFEGLSVGTTLATVTGIAGNGQVASGQREVLQVLLRVEAVS